ncbi:BMC domain-containing protein [Lachnoclostridium phytofermentans]|uniref:Microcompartments protein n=1 Tax=Lachnoclostridium phytofermentans (strain ATCC 700394 / DSM 18823 / ISDg) TaxID=357809 RepID=A9KN60_LACP7|nr:BMC domain-containing protein [Lachnoclostridium phytofermentans]ABX41559.1 microcompartments protein [Lachnoclostridium phytofermentans ISDg]
MGKSLGFIEISGVTAAIDALDIMCKTAGVELVTWERKMGGRLVTIIVSGSVSEVTQAVESAVNQAIKKPVAHAVIANPHEEVLRLVDISASRMKPQNEEM